MCYYDGLLFELHLFQVSLIEEFVCYELCYSVLDVPWFSYGANVTSSHHHPR